MDLVEQQRLGNNSHVHLPKECQMSQINDTLQMKGYRRNAKARTALHDPSQSGEKVHRKEIQHDQTPNTLGLCGRPVILPRKVRARNYPPYETTRQRKEHMRDSKSQKLSVFPARQLDLTPQVRRERKPKESFPESSREKLIL